MREKIISIIVEETGRLLDNSDNITADSRLFGADGALDSVGLVSLVVAVEQDISDEFDVDITLADVRAMSQKNSPFRTIGSLTEYAEKLVREAKG